MSTVDDLRAIEELKARYCRTLDTKDWTGFRAVFADDFVSDTTASGGPVVHGADEFVAFVRRSLEKAITVHQVQQPEITLDSPTAAHGIWAMQDVVRLVPGLTMHGFGHYVETYEKAGGAWRIRTSTLTRLREEISTPLFSVLLSDRIKRALGKLAARRS